ncbi:MAG TPA: FtsX-like permease family protein [Stellaceae bacterium]|jgi:cell division transport system permease protein|nr:FtsX-like permease family protein [Stellaceae bacterium]
MKNPAIPFDRGGTARFLPWLVALMVFLAALSLAAVMTLQHALEGWDASLSGSLTVELPPVSIPAPNPKIKTIQNNDAPPAKAGQNNDLAAVLALLRATPGIGNAQPLGRDDVARLIAPFLGNALSPEDLDLPRLIDVRIDAKSPPDLAVLQLKLIAIAPGAVIDDHRLWLDRLFLFARSVQITALVILALIGIVAVLTVMFVTRTGLLVHREAIELLHLMGARDGYIAHQFEREALRLGLVGGIAGLLLSGLALLALGHAAAASAFLGDAVNLVPALHLKGWNWLALAGLPLAAGLVAGLTARLTVLATLVRLP